MIGSFVGDQPMRRVVAHTGVRSRQIVLGCWVGHLRPGLFVHRGEVGSTHRFGWLADWSIRLHSHSESSCWLYNFPTFTCARPSQETWTDLHHLCVAETVLAVPSCCFMFMTYIFRHCGLLILKIMSVQAHRNVERVCMCLVCQCWTNW